MTSNNSKTPIQESVLAKIAREEVHMRPRAFFVLKLAATIALAVLVLALSIFLFNFLFFILRLNGHEALLSFGAPGMLLFITSFPWALLVLDLAALVLLWLLIRQFSFGYRSPWLYAVLVLLLVSAAGGLALDRATPLNDALLHQADGGHLPPPFNDLYRDSRHAPAPGSGEYRGIIQSITGNTFMLASYQQSTTTLIQVQKPSRGPGATIPLAIGDSVEVVGHVQGGVVQAFGIHPFDPDGVPPQMQPHP